MKPLTRLLLSPLIPERPVVFELARPLIPPENPNMNPEECGVPLAAAKPGWEVEGGKPRPPDRLPEVMVIEEPGGREVRPKALLPEL